jgi:hypothetical protein
MKLRSVAFVGVVCVAALGLIGVGAHAVFTTSTTSGQTITAGTGWGNTADPIEPTMSIRRNSTTKIDPPAPTVSITYPVDNTTYGSDWTGTMTGTASAAAGTTVTNTQVAIEDTTTNQWWNDTSFSATSQTFVKATGKTTWMLALAAQSLIPADTYTVVAQATDSAKNVGTSSTVSFTYGIPTAPPTVVVTYPVNNTTYADWTGTITGTASSNAGTGTTITSTAVAIEDTTTSQWWSGSSFNDATQTFVAATGNTTWLLTLEASNLTSGDSYSIVAEATDSAGNVGTSSTVSFTYGTTTTTSTTTPPTTSTTTTTTPPTTSTTTTSLASA